MFNLLNDINYYTNGKNLGLGVGLTTICYHSYLLGFNSILFFDQDTKFSLKTLKYISKISFEINNDFNLYAAIQFSNKLIKPNMNNKYSILKKKLLISSGSLFNLKNLKKLGWHNTEFFVDCVDYEFCLRAHNNKYLLGEIATTPDFDHVSGQADKTYKVLNQKLQLRKYNWIRVKDVFKASFKLILKSSFKLELTYTLIFIKSLVIFLFFQIFQRLLNLIYKINNNE